MVRNRKKTAGFAGLTLALGIILFAAGPARSPAPAEAQLLSGIVSLLLNVTKSILGSVGGVVSAGRWTVRVPAGAYDGTGSITVRTASATATNVDLSIQPASLNRFARPAMLTAQFPRGTNLTGYVIERYEPASNRWEAVPGSTVDAVNARVSAPLDHFSLYRVVQGKSGW
jgi:hypothetical protein